MEEREGEGLDLEDEEVEVEADRLNDVHVDDVDGLNSVIVLLIGFRLQRLKLKLIIDVVFTAKMATTFLLLPTRKCSKASHLPLPISFSFQTLPPSN